MPIAKESGFTPVPAGTHIARAIWCIALGTLPQNDPKFMDTFKIMLSWEIPGETIRIDDKDVPMTISKEYSLSLGTKANLRKDLVSWRGREFTAEELKSFEVSQILDKKCMLSVVHKNKTGGGTYASIAGMSALPKGTTCPDRVHELLRFEVEQGKSCAEWLKLPTWVQKKIETCEEWVHPPIDREESQTEPTITDDDVPF